MISLSIIDIKNFMAHLLSKDTFDRFYLVEASIKKEISYHIDGHLNMDFFDTGEGDKPDRSYCLWKDTRPLVYAILKGKRLPLGCKIVLGLPKATVAFLIKESQGSFREEDIDGIYLNILYDPTSLTLTTGISYRTFSLDKSLEQNVDDHIKKYLKSRGIC
ncbi:MAG: DUF5721 family protein [Clostridiales bacterium]|nr:DUF5721 family protein [Clostridiales bacterium]